nr:prepilin-type N-terminal cleavage/methylation domain-containing protein [uncultured Agathobaculum sp.]
MMEKMIAMQQKRRSRKGGFTLVELIVVLVILAILAALLIPALTGYIDRAKEKQIVAETRQCVMAAQTLADEYYAKNSGDPTFGSADSDKIKLKEIQDLADTKNAPTSAKSKDGKINELVYEGCTYSVTGNKATFTIKGKEVA